MARVFDRGRGAAADRRHPRWDRYLIVRTIKGPDRTIAQANRTAAEGEAAQRAIAAANAPQIEGQVVSTKELT